MTLTNVKNNFLESCFNSDFINRWPVIILYVSFITKKKYKETVNENMGEKNSGSRSDSSPFLNFSLKLGKRRTSYKGS